jgi:hypothetical protein
MQQSTATRRLVKSPPELWAELSTEDSLGRHLAEFGEIRITRVDPETTVAWEGDRVSGTVELAPTGWGTKVVLTATPAAEPAGREAAPHTEPAGAQGAPPEPAAAVPEPAGVVPESEAAVPEPAAAVPEPDAAVPEPEAAAPRPAAEPAKKRGFFARLFGRRDKTPKAAIPSRPAPAPAAKAAIPDPPAPAPDPTPAAKAAIPGPPVPAPDPTPPTPTPPSPTPGPPPVPDPSPPTPTPQPGPPPQIRAVPNAERRTAILSDVLATLGSDHHRPYSRERD